MAPADEAREHLKEAEKALKPSWMSLKFSPDHLTASMEYSNAATKFRAAGMNAESVQAWIRGGEEKEELGDLFGAGRAFESAGAICDGTGPGGSAAAVGHWGRATRLFRLSAKHEAAAKLLLKVAAIKEKDGDLGATKACYEEAIEVFQDDERLEYNLDDISKQQAGFLFRANLLEDALKVLDMRIALLSKQKQWPFVHKEMLTKAVVALQLKDTVRAEQALNPETMIEGWYPSRECQVGSELVAAFQAGDADAAAQALKSPTILYLQIEVARMAKQMQLPVGGSVSATGAGAADGGDGAKAPATADEIAESLM